MTAALLFLLFLIPLLTAALCAPASPARVRETVHLLGSLATAACALLIVSQVVMHGPQTAAGNFFYVDSLSAALLLIVMLVSVTAALHSIGYVRGDVAHGELTERRVGGYYAWFHLFVAAMYFVLVVNNLGIVWVAIEATTLTSAFLVALYRKAEALEAAWKYLILCSVGIAFALLGLIILYAAAESFYGAGNNRLDFTFLAHTTHGLPGHLLLLAFVLTLAGYGAKVGLAPLHFWLPDAHSQAPAPISGMLSGALLNTALYGILRLVIIVQHSGATPLVSELCLTFGLLSVLVAFPFLLLQQDVKRMLAYSSVEQMGIVLFAVGIGGEAGYLAAILQMFNHAMTKSTLFFSAGNLTQQYRTKNMSRIRGALRASPFSGVVFLLATLALVGAPPFSLFSSEFALSAAGFDNGHAIVTGALVLLLAALFGVMIFQMGRMLFGVPPRADVTRASPWMTWPLLVPVTFALVFGVFIPHAFQALFHHAALVLAGRLP